MNLSLKSELSILFTNTVLALSHMTEKYKSVSRFGINHITLTSVRNLNRLKATSLSSQFESFLESIICRLPDFAKKNRFEKTHKKLWKIDFKRKSVSKQKRFEMESDFLNIFYFVYFSNQLFFKWIFQATLTPAKSFSEKHRTLRSDTDRACDKLDTLEKVPFTGGKVNNGLWGFSKRIFWRCCENSKSA